MIAGIPSDKSLAGTGIDGFTVAKFNGSSNLLQNSFGAAISGVSGNLAFNPSAAHPELEFSISNLSKSGINPTQGFWIELYAGSGSRRRRGRSRAGLDLRPAVRASADSRTDDLDRVGRPGRWARLSPLSLAASECLTISLLPSPVINASLRKTAAAPSACRLPRSAREDGQYGRIPSETSQPPLPSRTPRLIGVTHSISIALST